MTERLSRAHARPAAPVRMLHLGPGDFHRAHQAWHTEHAPDAGEWGYPDFAGRSSSLGDQLAAQGGVFTLLVRGADGHLDLADDAMVALISELINELEVA